MLKIFMILEKSSIESRSLSFSHSADWFGENRQDTDRFWRQNLFQHTDSV